MQSVAHLKNTVCPQMDKRYDGKTDALFLALLTDTRLVLPRYVDLMASWEKQWKDRKRTREASVRRVGRENRVAKGYARWRGKENARKLGRQRRASTIIAVRRTHSDRIAQCGESFQVTVNYSYERKTVCSSFESRKELRQGSHRGHARYSLLIRPSRMTSMHESSLRRRHITILAGLVDFHS